MANVNVKFNNKDYLLSCDDGQEESLKKLTKFLDKKYSELQDKLGNIGENKLLIITTIQLIDEYFDLKQKVTDQKKKLDLISNKFKESRLLNYGDSPELPEWEDLLEANKDFAETSIRGTRQLVGKGTKSILSQE